MAVHFTGPILGKKKKYGSREWFSNIPMSLEPDYLVQTWDFLPDADTANPTSSSTWTVIQDGTASCTIGADKPAGEIILSGGATTDDTGSSIQLAQESMELQSGKNFWFEAKVKLNGPNSCDAFVGLCDAFATNPENCLTASWRAGLQSDDNDASWYCVAENASAQTKTDSGQDAVANTYQKLGFHYDGGSSIDFFIDRVKVKTLTSNVPVSAPLAVALFVLNGTTAARTLTCDYISCIMER